MGLNAKKEIKYREIIIAVPYSMTINVDIAFNDKTFRRIIKQNSELFGSKVYNDLWQNMVLTVYLIYLEG